MWYNTEVVHLTATSTGGSHERPRLCAGRRSDLRFHQNHESAPW